MFTRNLFVVLATVLATCTSALAQHFSVEVLPMPFNSALGHSSRQSMNIGISRDGTLISGSGYEFDNDPGGFPDTFRYAGSVAYQYNRLTHAYSYFPSPPGGGSATYFQTASPNGDAGIVTSGLQRNYYWVAGQSGYMTPFTGPGELYMAMSNGAHTLIGETPTSPYGGFVYHEGAMQSPIPPSGFDEYYPNAVSGNGSSFITYEGLYYRFGAGWLNLNEMLPSGWDSVTPSAISDDGMTIVGTFSGLGRAGDFRWSAQSGFTDLHPDLSLAIGFTSGNSDLSVLFYGGAMFSSTEGLVDMAGRINSSGAMPAGLSMVSLTGLANDGRTFSGVATDTLNRSYSVVVTTVPCPSIAGVAVAGGLVATRRRRR